MTSLERSKNRLCFVQDNVKPWLTRTFVPANLNDMRQNKWCMDDMIDESYEWLGFLSDSERYLSQESQYKHLKDKVRALMNDMYSESYGYFTNVEEDHLFESPNILHEFYASVTSIINEHDTLIPKQSIKESRGDRNKRLLQEAKTTNLVMSRSKMKRLIGSYYGIGKVQFSCDTFYIYFYRWWITEKGASRMSRRITRDLNLDQSNTVFLIGNRSPKCWKIIV